MDRKEFTRPLPRDSWVYKFWKEKLENPTRCNYQYEDLRGELADMQEDGADFNYE